MRSLACSFRQEGSGGRQPSRGNVVSNVFYHCCAPLLGGQVGGMHIGLLDYYVRTDTFGVRSGGFRGRGCVAPIVCDVCGLPFKRCRCRVSVDY